MNTLVSQEKKQAVQLYTDDLANFCRFVVEYTELSKNPEWTTTVCEEQAETVRIKRQDLSTETIDMLLDTLLTVIDNLESKRLQEQQQKQWIWRVKKRFQDRLKRI